MTFWKPLALGSTSAFVMMVGYQAAFANAASPSGTSVAGQPNMEAALGHLQAAKASLQAAEHNKGGWRAAALSATETAISETRRGMAFAGGQ
jgi:hypothetical protein